MPATHRAVSILPRCRDAGAVLEGDLLHTTREQLLLDFAGTNKPALAGGSGLFGTRGSLGSSLLPVAELAELAGVGQEPVEQTDAARSQEEPADVDQDLISNRQAQADADRRNRQADRGQIAAPHRGGRRDGQVVRSIGSEVAVLLLDAVELAPWDQQEHVGVPAELAAAALQDGIGLLLRVLVQRRQLGGGQKVPHLVDGDGRVPRQVQDRQRHDGLGTEEHEPQHFQLEVGAFFRQFSQFQHGKAQHRRDKGGVEGDELVVRDHPAAFQITRGIHTNPAGPRQSVPVSVHFHL